MNAPPRIRQHLRLALISFAVTAAAAQAPIERVPPPSTEWTIFAERAPDFSGSEIAVHTDRHTVHCDLRHADADTLFCYPRVPFPLLFPPNLPNETIPRQHIHSVQRIDRPASTLLGFGIGLGFGTGVYAYGNRNLSGQELVLSGVLTGTIGALIGHTFPLIHHTLYRAPKS